MAEAVEFEHFIGLNVIPKSAIFHPNGQKYVFSSGASLVIGDLIDQHVQSFLTKHDDNIISLALSSSGSRIASGQKGESADIYVWDYDTLEALYRFEEHDFAVQDLSFSEDEHLLASIGHEDDGKLIIWDMSNGCIVATANNVPQGTACVKFGGFVKDIKRRDTSHYLIVTAGADGAVMWDLDPYSGDMMSIKLVGEVRATLSRCITDISFSNDREYLYGSTTSGDYIIASIKANKILHAQQATKMKLNAILVTASGIVIGCGDSSVKLYNTQGDFKGQACLDGSVASLSLSPDQLEVLATTAAGTIARVNLATLKYILISESHTGAIVQVAYDKGSNERFATASLDGTLRVWDIVEYVMISTARARKEQERGVVPQCLVFANILISGWSDGRLLAHSAETGDSLWVLDNAHPGGVTAVALSNNRRFVLSGGPAGEVRLWELRSRELISHLKEHKQKVTSLMLFEDDTMAVSGSRDRCILRWDLRNEMRVHCHMQRMGGINDLVLSKGAQNYTISVGQDKKIVVWNNRLNDPVYAQYIDGENDEGLAIAISNDGGSIVTGGSAGKLCLWRLNEEPSTAVSLEKICSCKGHSSSITSLTFSLDDKQVVSVGDDGAIFVWTAYIS